MCGIAGSYRAPWFDVARALERIRHRGPDAEAVRVDGDLVHGHVRLSVLDLSSASDQPFRYGGSWLSYNGELWNYEALRAELAALGCSFRTTGDTEVVAAALYTWGTAALARMEGMFALCWSHGGTRLLARDRFGKVPLYVLRRGPGFTWASERKAWGKGHGAAAAPLPPGTWLDLETGKVHAYYRLPPPAAPPTAGELLALLREGVHKRMVADAPLCVLCSGGLDSSLILALAREVRSDLVAYTAKHDPDSADLHAARRLCSELGVPLCEVEVTAPTARELEAAVRAIELGSKAQTEIAVLCLPLAARIQADGFKVTLSGEAADELFGGYGSMRIAGAKGENWRALQIAQLSKMARGNFVRCNKAFMAHGVECRLPFMDRALVEHALTVTFEECYSPRKGALKRAAAGVVPRWIIDRQKDTFQGGSGMAAACARAIAAPTRFYNATARSAFGGTVDA